MAISIKPATAGAAQAYQALADSISSTLRVALPGIIQSFDPEAVTCVVQPAIKGSVLDTHGQPVSLALPLLVDVPVVFPRGGGCTITFPVRAGDECLVIFSDRCIDFWWQSGGVQEPVDPRQHDLSDGFALVGPQSQKEKIGAISTDALQIRTDEGQAFIELKQSGEVNITTSQLTVNGNLQVNGEITSSGDQIASGISQVGHVHGGVQSGGSYTKGAQ
ncbi:Gp138 family membrane-puncturing spike protein [Erwinia sp. CGal63]|uniref:Gp138 family membrane-puncturing spike protein n=1 Tax=Erwinia sp. CGal63 TaxID=2919889 RepID=UPI00300B2A60